MSAVSTRLTERKMEANIIREIFVDDGYRAGMTIADGDVWLDVGCHNGWWSTLALAMGAQVAGGIDADRNAVLRYNSLVGPEAVATQAMVSGIDSLMNVVRQLDNQPNAMKMDIQGSERDILMYPDSIRELSHTFKKLLFEWHDRADLLAMLGHLETYYTVVWVQLTQDTMTLKPAYLVYAVSR